MSDKPCQRGDNRPPSNLTPKVVSKILPNLSKTALSDSTIVSVGDLAGYGEIREIWEANAAMAPDYELSDAHFVDLKLTRSDIYSSASHHPRRIPDELTE